MYDQWAVDNKLTGIFEEDSTSGSMDFASLLSNKSERTYEGLAKTLNNSLMELRENMKVLNRIWVKESIVLLNGFINLKIRKI